MSLQVQLPAIAAPPPPEGLEVAVLELEGETLALLSFPIDPSAASLTLAEREVVRGVLGGRSNAEIARRRGTSVRTVANQLASVYRKLGICSRAELVALGAALGPARQDEPR